MNSIRGMEVIYSVRVFAGGLIERNSGVGGIIEMLFCVKIKNRMTDSYYQNALSFSSRNDRHFAGS